ncbi:YgiT-type zinc finger protein [Brevibacillus sp. FSL L8-0710]|uniref:YgiT-type zinc finger protein n=1 Tax=Brevibacillus sp. FSL L8-0710 TaxID=2975313 RepID=UPI0030F6BA82
MTSIKQCVFCGCTNVPPAELEIYVKSKHIKSVKVDGFKCSQCGEQFYHSDALKIIEEIEKLK